MTQNESANTDKTPPPQELSINLTIREPNIVKFLSKYDGQQREDKAIEALKVGVVAILSASPSLDTKIVDEKFREIERKLKEYSEAFAKSLAGDLAKYFEKEKGDVPAVLNSFFGDRGVLSEALKNYLDPEKGKISALLQNELGASSAFAKSLDPANKESVISRIEKTVETKLLETTKGLVDQFSLDKDDSGMSRIKKMVDEKITEIKKTNDAFFGELREHLNIKKAVVEEAEKGTQKGRDFESVLYDKIAQLGSQLEDNTENVTGIPGAKSRAKVGDYVVTLGETSGAPGKRIVFEVKKSQNYNYKDAATELKEAKENREADCGIFVFAKGYEPAETGDFRIDADDFFCTVDQDALDKNQPLLFLEAAYKIARVHVVTRSRKEAKGEIDLTLIKSNIQKMLNQVDMMADLLTKAQTIQKSGKSIEENTTNIKDDLEALIRVTLELLK